MTLVAVDATILTEEPRNHFYDVLLRPKITDQLGRVELARVRFFAIDTYNDATDTGTAIDGSMYNARSGGSVITQIITSAQGEIEAWFDTPQQMDMVVDDNGGLARFPDTGVAALFNRFTEDRRVIAQPGSSRYLQIHEPAPQYWVSALGYDTEPVGRRGRFDSPARTLTKAYSDIEASGNRGWELRIPNGPQFSYDEFLAGTAPPGAQLFPLTSQLWMPEVEKFIGPGGVNKSLRCLVYDGPGFVADPAFPLNTSLMRWTGAGSLLEGIVFSNRVGSGLLLVGKQKPSGSGLKNTLGRTRIVNVTCTNCLTDGFRSGTAATDGLLLLNCEAKFNGRYGLFVGPLATGEGTPGNSSNNVRAEGCSFRKNTVSNVRLAGPLADTGARGGNAFALVGCSLMGSYDVSEDPGGQDGPGVHITGWHGVVIRQCYFETTSGLSANQPMILIRGTRDPATGAAEGTPDQQQYWAHDIVVVDNYMHGFGIEPSAQNGLMTALSPVLTSGSVASPAGLGWEAGDVGRVMRVVGAGVAGADLVTTIASVQSQFQATLADAASTTVAASGTPGEDSYVAGARIKMATRWNPNLYAASEGAGRHIDADECHGLFYDLNQVRGTQLGDLSSINPLVVLGANTRAARVHMGTITNEQRTAIEDDFGKLVRDDGTGNQGSWWDED